MTLKIALCWCIFSVVLDCVLTSRAQCPLSGQLWRCVVEDTASALLTPRKQWTPKARWVLLLLITSKRVQTVCKVGWVGHERQMKDVDKQGHWLTKLALSPLPTLCFIVIVLLANFYYCTETRAIRACWVDCTSLLLVFTQKRSIVDANDQWSEDRRKAVRVLP